MHYIQKYLWITKKLHELYGSVLILDTPTFFYGMKDLVKKLMWRSGQGKTLMVKLVSIGEPQPVGNRVLYFEFNGQPVKLL